MADTVSGPDQPQGTIGIIGLGIMGGAMAANLVRGGWRVIGYDIDATAREAARQRGVEVADGAAALAVATSDIILSLPSGEAAIASAATIAAAAPSRAVVLEMSTLSLEDKHAVARALASHGHIALDCPLSGTGAQAQSKDLVVYASGHGPDIERLVPLFLGLGRRYFNLGDYGNATKMKFVANLLVAIHNVASAEAMVLGMKAGLDPSVIFEMISNGAGNSRVFELRAPMMVKNDYSDVTMKCSVWQKDMDVIGAFAKKMRVPTPLFSATLPVYAAALKSGHAEDDTAAVCAVLEAKANVKRRRVR